MPGQQPTQREERGHTHTKRPELPDLPDRQHQARRREGIPVTPSKIKNPQKPIQVSLFHAAKRVNPVGNIDTMRIISLLLSSSYRPYIKCPNVSYGLSLQFFRE